ncbi:unnamed protein product [Prorocentrum cordatum]|uniref:Nucleotide exchange factor SIL1 n=1 Tax=Prorocentrum cordatum TaxID=2364126 RepID=A0ABN9TWW0_9DINO|nr:unnamed protein product [Polarella glacialis]
MWRLPFAAGLAAQALVCLSSPQRSACAADALALVQSSAQVSRSAAVDSDAGAAVHSTWKADAETEIVTDAEDAGWEDQGGTIGDISPRMIDDDDPLLTDGAAALQAQRRQAEERRARAAATVTESQVEVLSTAINFALARVGASLDEHMALTTQLKDGLLGARQGEAGTPGGSGQDPAALLQLGGNGSRQDRLVDLENSLDQLQSIFQGWSTVGVVLRSSVQSMESKLETFGQRDVAATVGARLDDALEAFDASLQTTFGELDGNLTGIGDESPDGDGADGRIRQLHRSLKVFCRDTNGFAHIFNQNMHNLAESIADRARQSNMKEVELQRVGTVFDGLQQAADAISWKIYSDAWTLTTGMFIASSGLLRGHGGAEPQARAGEDVLAAGEAPPSEAVAPLKMSRAQALTKAMAKLEGQVDDLINHTKEEMRRVAEAVNANVSKLDRAAGESLVMRAIDAELLPEWGRVGEQLHTPGASVLLTQCLENAGQDELAARLSSLLDSNISIRSGGALVLEPARPGAFDADLDAFVQREDLLAYSFYKAFAEFLNGLRASPGNGRVVDQRTVLLSKTMWKVPPRRSCRCSPRCTGVSAPRMDRTSPWRSSAPQTRMRAWGRSRAMTPLSGQPPFKKPPRSHGRYTALRGSWSRMPTRRPRC